MTDALSPLLSQILEDSVGNREALLLHVVEDMK